MSMSAQALDMIADVRCLMLTSCSSLIICSQGHYIEALGDEPVEYLELFKASRYQDVSLSNWLSLMPPHVIQNHLGFSDATMKKLQSFRTHNNQVVQNGKSKRDLPLPYGGRQMWA